MAKNNMKTERIASECNRCDGYGKVYGYIAGTAHDCPKCDGHGKLVVATRYVCDVKEPFPKAKD